MFEPKNRDATVWVSSGNLPAALEQSRTDPTRTVALASHRGFREANLEFLQEWTHVQNLCLLHLEGTDLSGLRHLPHLTRLLADGCDGRLDFTWTPNLRELYLSWTPITDLGSLPRTVEVLHVSSFKPEDGGLESIPDLPGLREVSVVNSKIQKLDGIERFKELVKLELALNPRLNFLCALTRSGSSKLDFLDICSCKKIVDYATLQGLAALRVLRINAAGAVESLRFTEQLPRLEELRFMDTTVTDGDMTPCLRLKRVAFTSKKHYTHTLLQVKKLIGDKVERLPAHLLEPKGGAKVARARRPAMTDVERDRREKAALKAIQKAFGTEDGADSVDLFVEHHMAELPASYWEEHLGTSTPDPEALLGLLCFRSSWDDEDGQSFDFTLPDEVTQYVLSVHFGRKGKIDGLAMES
jgi:hypothetical protein